VPQFQLVLREIQDATDAGQPQTNITGIPGIIYPEVAAMLTDMGYEVTHHHHKGDGKRSFTEISWEYASEGTYGKTYNEVHENRTSREGLIEMLELLREMDDVPKEKMLFLDDFIRQLKKKHSYVYGMETGDEDFVEDEDEDFFDDDDMFEVEELCDEEDESENTDIHPYSFDFDE